MVTKFSWQGSSFLTGFGHLIEILHLDERILNRVLLTGKRPLYSKRVMIDAASNLTERVILGQDQARLDVRQNNIEYVALGFRFEIEFVDGQFKFSCRIEPEYAAQIDMIATRQYAADHDWQESEEK